MKQLSEIYMPQTTEVTLIVLCVNFNTAHFFLEISSYFLKFATFSRSFVFVNAVVSSGISTCTDASNSKETHNPFPFTSCSSVGTLSDDVFLMVSGRGSNDSMLCILYFFILPYSCF